MKFIGITTRKEQGGHMRHRACDREGGMLDKQTHVMVAPRRIGQFPKLLVSFWCSCVHENSPCRGITKGSKNEEGFWVSDSVGGGENKNLNLHYKYPAKTKLKTLWKWLGIVLPSHSDNLKSSSFSYLVYFTVIQRTGSLFLIHSFIHSFFFLPYNLFVD